MKTLLELKAEYKKKTGVDYKPAKAPAKAGSNDKKAQKSKKVRSPFKFVAPRQN